MGLEDKVKAFYERSLEYINYKMGSLSGLLGGGVVFYINLGHGFGPASGAFGKQFLYNVFVGGFNLRTCERLAKKISSKPLALLSATIVPTVQAFIINYAIHKLGETPEAFDSSIWQVYCNAPIFFGFGLYYEKRNEEQNENC